MRREAIRGNLRGLKVGNRWRFAPEDLRAYLARSGNADYTELIEAAVKAAPRLQPWQVQRLTALFDYTPPVRPMTEMERPGAVTKRQAPHRNTRPHH